MFTKSPSKSSITPGEKMFRSMSASSAPPLSNTSAESEDLEDIRLTFATIFGDTGIFRLLVLSA